MKKMILKEPFTSSPFSWGIEFRIEMFAVHTVTSITTSSWWAQSSVSSLWFNRVVKNLSQVSFIAMKETSREPSPKIAVRIGVENMEMIVNKTATPAVMEEMNNLGHDCLHYGVC